jgi:hypothetical protein
MHTEEVNLIVSGLSLVLQAVSLIPREPRNRTKEDENALAALSDAYHTTLQYYEFLKDNPRDLSKEAGIAYKWEIVGIVLQKYDSTLAERLDAKSRYWREGATWSDEVIRQAGIGLENIRREVTVRIKHGV